MDLKLGQKEKIECFRNFVLCRATVCGAVENTETETRTSVKQRCRFTRRLATASSYSASACVSQKWPGRGVVDRVKIFPLIWFNHRAKVGRCLSCQRVWAYAGSPRNLSKKKKEEKYVSSRQMHIGLDTQNAYKHQIFITSYRRLQESFYKLSMLATYPAGR